MNIDSLSFALRGIAQEGLQPFLRNVVCLSFLGLKKDLLEGIRTEFFATWEQVCCAWLFQRIAVREEREIT